MRNLVAAVAVLAVACGGGGEAGAGEQQETARPGGGAAPAPAMTEGTGTVHEVDMLLTNDGNYRYVPDQLTIKVGDTVRWLNVSGFPHNVAFYQDKIPQGAAEVLTGLIPAEGKIGPLSSRLMLQPNEVVEMTFVGVPTGEYGYYCTPHEALGMVATLTIQP